MKDIILQNHFKKIKNKDPLNQLKIFFDFIDKSIEKFNKGIDDYYFQKGIEKNVFECSFGKYEKYSFDFIQFLYEKYVPFDKKQIKIFDFLSLINILIFILFDAQGYKEEYWVDPDLIKRDEHAISCVFKEEFNNISEFKDKFESHIKFLYNLGFAFDWNNFILMEHNKKIIIDNIKVKNFEELYISYLSSEGSEKRNIISNIARGMICFVEKHKNNKEYTSCLINTLNNDYLSEYIKWTQCLRHNENEKGKANKEIKFNEWKNMSKEEKKEKMNEYINDTFIVLLSLKNKFSSDEINKIFKEELDD